MDIVDIAVGLILFAVLCKGLADILKPGGGRLAHEDKRLKRHRKP